MSKRRIDQAVEVVVDRVETHARDDGLDVTTASNVAHDTAMQDATLTSLCERCDSLSVTEREIRRRRASFGHGDEVTSRTLDAGIALDDAIQARVEELVDEVIEDVERLAIEEVTA
jgi:hypothetical protein